MLFKLSDLLVNAGLCSIENREDVSETHCDGLHTVKSATKITQAFELKECPERCLVRLYLCPVDNAFVRSNLSTSHSSHKYTNAFVRPL